MTQHLGRIEGQLRPAPPGGRAKPLATCMRAVCLAKPFQRALPWDEFQPIDGHGATHAHPDPLGQSGAGEVGTSQAEIIGHHLGGLCVERVFQAPMIFGVPAGKAHTPAILGILPEVLTENHSAHTADPCATRQKNRHEGGVAQGTPAGGPRCGGQAPGVQLADMHQDVRDVAHDKGTRLARDHFVERPPARPCQECQIGLRVHEPKDGAEVAQHLPACCGRHVPVAVFCHPPRESIPCWAVGGPLVGGKFVLAHEPSQPIPVRPDIRLARIRPQALRSTLGEELVIGIESLLPEAGSAKLCRAHLQ